MQHEWIDPKGEDTVPVLRTEDSVLDYIDSSKLIALLLSCPTLNQDANYFFDDAKDPFVAPQASSDIGDIHTGCCYTDV